MSDIATWGNNRTALRGKRSKLSYQQEIKSLRPEVVEIDNLTLKELKVLLKVAKDTQTVSLVEFSNKKAPYIEELDSLFASRIDLKKLSVRGLRSLMESFKCYS